MNDKQAAFYIFLLGLAFIGGTILGRFGNPQNEVVVGYVVGGVITGISLIYGLISVFCETDHT